MEGWLSGRKRRIANPLYDFFRTEGSNPFPSLNQNMKQNFKNHLQASIFDFCFIESKKEKSDLLTGELGVS